MLVLSNRGGKVNETKEGKKRQNPYRNARTRN